MESNIQDKLKALFDAYTKNLPGKINTLEKQWQDLIQQWSVEKLIDFHRAVHSLCGSAGTYGYRELSQAAHELEIFLKTLIDKDSVTQQNQHQIMQLLNKMVSTEMSIQEEKSTDKENVSVKILPNNKVVYMLDDDVDFTKEVKANLVSMEYKVKMFQDFSELETELLNKLPGAIIVDMSRLDESGIQFLHDFKDNDSPIPLFCTARQADLTTRLNAIRIGGISFFQKPMEPFYLTKTIDQACGSSTVERLRVLIVDDSQSLSEYYAVVLEEAGMEVRTVLDPMRVLEALSEFRPDLLLLDVYMPGCNGLELAAVLRQEMVYAGIPIVFLSTEDDRFKQLAALSIGGDDFLTKPILPQHLVATVRSRAKRAGILTSYMTKDSLTGLLNHTNILQHLDIELARSGRLSNTLCFIMIDIDHFKSVNDLYGHPMGDRVLRKLSELLLVRLRRTDLVGRYGGEEFAIILPNTDSETATSLCAQLREKFSKVVFKSEDQRFNVTFSAGIGTYPLFSQANALIQAADGALYKAKHQGRNREVVAK
jgi:diguanylate cyclase (GGDEF)-like protein